MQALERSAMRKIYLRILPFAVLSYVLAYIDRRLDDREATIDLAEHCIGACGFLTHFSAVSGASSYATASTGQTRQASEPRQARVSSKKQRHWASVR